MLMTLVPAGAFAAALSPDETHIVAGDPALCGSNWDPSDSNNLMTYSEEDGCYYKIYENVNAGTYNFKVTTNRRWDAGDYNLNGSANYGGSDATAVVAENGSTVIIGFNGEKATLEIVSPSNGESDSTSPVDIGDTYADEYADLTALAATYPAALEVSKNEVDDITIKLLSDVTGRIELAIPDSNFILDANGKTFSGGEQNEAVSIVNRKNCTLYVVGNGTFTSGRNNTFFVGQEGVLFVQSATISGKINTRYGLVAQAIRAEGKPCFSMKINDGDPVIYTSAQNLACGETDTIVITPLDAIPHSHPVCGDSECEDSHGDIEWTEWTSTTSLPTTSGNYYLGNDVTISSTSYIDGANVNLCLNGHKVDSDDEFDIFSLKDNANLSICDCQTDGTIGGESDPVGFCESNATFNLYSGILVSNTGNTIGKGTGYDGADNTVNIYGGYVKSTTLPAVVSIVGNTVVNLYGGNILATERNGVLVMEASRLNLCGNPVIAGSGLADNTINNDIKTYASNAIDATGYTGDTLTVYYAKDGRQVGDVVIMNVTDETAAKFILSEANDGYMLKREGNNLVYAEESGSVIADLPDTVNEKGPRSIEICNFVLDDGDYLATNDATEVSEDYTNGTPYVAVYKNGILYLNGLETENNARDKHTIAWGYSYNGKHDLVIELVEGSINTLVDNYDSAINGYRGSSGGPSVIVQGNGTINIDGEDFGFWVWQNITIQNGATVNVTGGNSGISNNTSRGKIVIKPGTNVNISGGKYGVKTDNYDRGTFYVEGGTITVKGNTSAVYSINCDFGNIPVYVSENVSGDGATLWDGTTDITNYKYIRLSGTRTEVTPTYTVTFDANGGTVDTATLTTETDGKLATLPTPTKSGNYRFNGWFTAASGGTEITTDTVFIEDSTIYAQWTYTGSSGGGSRYYNVTFNTNGGSKLASQRLRRNAVATEPEEPTKDGFEFEGWYTDKEFKNAYDFATKVTKSFTLYAKWVEAKATHVCSSDKFSDLDKTKWYHEDIDYVIENNIMLGTSDTVFAPEENLTRGMLVTILYRSEGEPATNRSIPFADVDMGAYYANAVVWAQQNGIVKGISETEYAPDMNVTREQLATIMLRYAQFKGMDAVTAEEKLGFNDTSDISDWAVAAMNWGVGRDYIFGRTEGVIAPKVAATRAEIAAFIHRYIVNNEK